MISSEQYLSILLSLPTLPKKGETISVTIGELANVLYCTPRNVKLILRKLAEDGFIQWRGGVGRGHPSQMTPLRDFNEVAVGHFQDLLVKDKIKEAMNILYLKDLPLPLRHKLHRFLENRFGFQVERANATTVDVLRVTMRRKPDSLDPAFVSTSTEAFLLQQICDTLLVFNPKEKTFIPGLAHSWESNDDGSQWTFYLRKGVRFHNGKLLTSKDVLYTFQRLQELQSPSRWQYEEVIHVEIPSDFIITFHLRQPNLLFLHFLSSFYMYVLPHDVTFSSSGIIGTGPFRMTEFTNQVLVLEAYEDYFRERALLDRVELWFVPEDIQDDLYQLPDWSGQGEKKAAEIEYLMDGSQFVVFNFRKKGIHHNRYFRKAMRLIFDRLSIIEELAENRISPANSFLPVKSKQADYERSPIDLAKNYLRESGYSGETLKLYYLDKKEFVDDARWLQQRCEAAGLTITLHPISFDNYYLTNADEEADLLIICESLEDDTEWGYLNLFQNESSFLRRFLSDKQHSWLDELLLQFVQTPSAEERDKIIDKVEQKILDEEWLLFGYHMNKISRYHPALNGVSFDSFGWINFSKLWIRKDMQG
ncbi:hypothetical protein AN964_03840 [Heyndrickxia shackletonii]|uniref:SgrR family transcriptional regulator n=1 Tax=Heyndrickxia shackletonii TaxID=157838 RepID=A0A0Q3TF62_9BACI|nr:SgrR family transcriptional regulator [Heyndrickxia shackletonii]KQL52736.1 hypothetical protein AN964_03840 [Heyndrickxia shackletonii]NEZ00134.1 SgrR family transcriptional regulator [Heyndrickxia shackletonii]